MRFLSKGLSKVNFAIFALVFLGCGFDSKHFAEYATFTRVCQVSDFVMGGMMSEYFNSKTELIAGGECNSKKFVESFFCKDCENKMRNILVSQQLKVDENWENDFFWVAKQLCESDGKNLIFKLNCFVICACLIIDNDSSIQDSGIKIRKIRQIIAYYYKILDFVIFKRLGLPFLSEDSLEPDSRYRIFPENVVKLVAEKKNPSDIFTLTLKSWGNLYLPCGKFGEILQRVVSLPSNELSLKKIFEITSTIGGEGGKIIEDYLRKKIDVETLSKMLKSLEPFFMERDLFVFFLKTRDIPWVLFIDAQNFLATHLQYYLINLNGIFKIDGVLVKKVFLFLTQTFFKKKTNEDDSYSLIFCLEKNFQEFDREVWDMFNYYMEILFKVSYRILFDVTCLLLGHKICQSWETEPTVGTLENFSTEVKNCIAEKEHIK